MYSIGHSCTCLQFQNLRGKCKPISELKARRVYVASSRLVWTTYIDPISKPIYKGNKTKKEFLTPGSQPCAAAETLPQLWTTAIIRTVCDHSWCVNNHVHLISDPANLGFPLLLFWTTRSCCVVYTDLQTLECWDHKYAQPARLSCTP